ncbi:MAG: redoxin domain-containing protein [Chloroflexi bacterium]|nr:redoxin domain-containing protein [Chloroflexota bacterium]
MTTKFFSAMIAAFLALSGAYGAAAETGDAKAELQELVNTIQARLKEGKRTEQDLAEELKQFDALLARHKEEKSEDVAQILYMKATLYLQVFDQAQKGIELITQLKNDYPDTAKGKKAEEIIASFKQREEAKKIQSTLVAGTRFPDFEEKDLAGKPLSLANYKGKAVLLDFWATWCGPCVSELPNVLKTYEKHHAKGFEIIGISLDKDEEALRSFIKKRNMPWPQVFDGKGWGSKLAVKHGVNSIPATYLLDGEGKIVVKDLRGDELEAEVARILAKP